MDREYLKREKQLTHSSEAQLHETSPYYRSTHEKNVSGYEPHPAEKEERGTAKELFSMNNSYNNISVGADKKGDITIAGSAVRRHDSPTLENDRKRVEGSRRKKHPSREGEFFTNPAKEEESAFAYRVDRRMPEKKMLKNLRESENRHDLERMAGVLPFLDLRENEEYLQDLRQNEAGESEKQSLETLIRDKKKLEMKFLKNLRLTRKKVNSTDLEDLRCELYGDSAAPISVPTSIPAEASGEEDDTADGEEKNET